MSNPPSMSLGDKSRRITFSDTNDWGAGFVGAVSIANLSTFAIDGWTLAFDLASDITTLWNAQIVSHVGTHYVVSDLAYDSVVPPGGTVAFGFQTGGGNPLLPSTATFNAAVPGGSALPTLTTGTASVTETGAASVNESFTVRLSAASATPVTVGYATADGTAHGCCSSLT